MAQQEQLQQVIRLALAGQLLLFLNFLLHRARVGRRWQETQVMEPAVTALHRAPILSALAMTGKVAGVAVQTKQALMGRPMLQVEEVTVLPHQSQAFLLLTVAVAVAVQPARQAEWSALGVVVAAARAANQEPE